MSEMSAAQKKKLLADIEKQKEEFLKRGGKITQCNPGETIKSHRKLINPDQRLVN